MKALFAAVSLLAIAACSDADHRRDADRITHESLIVDTHIDVPYRLAAEWEDVAAATAKGDFDHPRAMAGGLNAPFMSIYTPAQYDGTPKARMHAEEMIAIVERIAREAPEKYRIARTTADVEQAFRDGAIALPMGMENGSPISGELANLDHFYGRGIRYITLAHSKANDISDSSYDMNRRWHGLSDFGRQVVARMNELGIMVDVSHISDEAFWDVMETSRAPVIASHSSARHFTPDFERNMSDDMIKALAEHDGVIQINFGSAFLTQAANKYRPAMEEAYQAYLAGVATGTDPMSKENFEIEYGKSHPYPFATLRDVLDHIDHVVQLTGIDHVGIGSDYDGVDDTLPTGLKDVASYPALVAGLLERGYTETDIRKILGGNLMRVWRAVEDYAANH